MALSQSNIMTPDGRKVDCSAWVYAGGDLGQSGTVTFDAFLDGVWCGGTQVRASNGYRWRKIGQEVAVQGGAHTLSIVVVADAKGEQGAGIEISLDDGRVGWC